MIGSTQEATKAAVFALAAGAKLDDALRIAATEASPAQSASYIAAAREIASGVDPRQALASVQFRPRALGPLLARDHALDAVAQVVMRVLTKPRTADRRTFVALRVAFVSVVAAGLAILVQTFVTPVFEKLAHDFDTPFHPELVSLGVTAAVLAVMFVVLGEVVQQIRSPDQRWGAASRRMTAQDLVLWLIAGHHAGMSPLETANAIATTGAPSERALANKLKVELTPSHRLDVAATIATGLSRRRPLGIVPLPGDDPLGTAEGAVFLAHSEPRAHHAHLVVAAILLAASTMLITYALYTFLWTTPDIISG